MNYHWIVGYYPKINGYYAQASIYLGKNSKPRYKTLYLHRYILNAVENDNIYVHHKDHKQTLDNRKSNLIGTSNENNSKDRKGKNKNNKTGYRNVTFTEGRYVVQLQVEGRNKRIATFEDPHEAGAFAKEMRLKYYGDFSGLD
ncbi:hypothetical protein [Paenibacillus ferrarius]|uniref:hypothetical protein n=1 Tax=Paenibacillus ferrarius TaxID=1469647 RepID=UPI00117D0B58|nr:hypothetical protein [Paenibacillus ferrarius]